MIARLLLPTALAAAIGTSSGAAPAVPRPPRHVALLIGIADYKNFAPAPGEPGHTDLNAPGNDVERMRFTLRRFGFAGDSDIRVLRDSAASRRGIAAGFRWLAERATDTADVVVVFYSGHGTRVRDTNGDEARTTPGDSTDEALVPWDAANTSDASQVVLDDQVGAWLAALKTTNVTMIVDGCFSGTITRALGTVVPKGTFSPEHGGGGRSGGPHLLDNPAHTLITAAASGETAYEMPFGTEQRWFSAFTYELTRVLDAAEPTAHYDDVMRDVTRAIRENREAPQTPQLEGAGDALLFHVGAALPRQAFVVVTALDAGRVRIDAGAVHGVRRAALYDVYPAAETAFAEPSRVQIVIDSVGESAAWGRALGEVATGSRAVLARMPRGAEAVHTLRVSLAPEAAAARPMVTALPFVTVVDSGDAEAHVKGGAGGFDITLAGIPVAALAAEGGAAALCPRLARAFAIKAFDAVDNPAAPLSIELESRFVESGAPPPTDGAAVDTLVIGRLYDFWLRVGAREGETLYLTAAAEGYTGPPVLILPDPSRPGPNQPYGGLNQWRRILNGIPAREPTGTESVKLLVGSDQYDFRTLIQTFPSCAVTGTRTAPSAPPAVRWRAWTRRVQIVRAVP